MGRYEGWQTGFVVVGNRWRTEALSLDESCRQLFEEHVDQLFRLALRVTGCAETAQRVVEDVFVGVFDTMACDRAEPPSKQWLQRAAVAGCAAYLRRTRRRRRHWYAGRNKVALDRVVGNGSGSHALHEMDCILRALSQMSVECRLVVTLFHMEGCSLAETAELLEISERTARRRLLRGRRKLAWRVQEYDRQHLPTASRCTLSTA